MTRTAIRRASVITSVSALVALGSLAAAAPASAEVLPPTYYPVGPQLNVPVDALVGWELCYADLYGDSGQPLYGDDGLIDELCTGEFLLLAGAPIESETLSLLAAAPRADVLTDTGTDETTTHVANGTAWYFNADYSWGFALPGTGVEKSSCDVAEVVPDSASGDFRLCFHTDGQELDGGYRLGEIAELNGSTEYARFVFQSDGSPAPAPAPELAATGSDSSAPLLAAGALLVAGMIGLAATTVRRRSA